MTETKRFDVNITCRICLQTEPDLISMFQTYDAFNSLGEILSKCTGVSFFKDDGLPSQICQTCCRDLTNTNYFVEKCQQSDKELRGFLEFIKKEEESQTVEIEVKLERNSDSEHNDGASEDYEGSCNSDSKLNKKYTVKANENRKQDEVIGKHKIKKESAIFEKCKNPIPCGTCGVIVASKSALIIHARCHTGEKPFTCNFCLKSFSQKSTLTLHIKRKHSETNTLKRLVCDNCGKTFASAANLRIHARIHTGELPYACDFCPKRFKQQNSRLSHMRTHSGEKPFVCQLCGKGFKESTHLKRHQSVHSQDKPFICNTCGKCVKSAHALKEHSKIHTNLKNGVQHICDQCGMSLSNKGNLDSHIRVVHSEKSGQCSVCRKMCSDLADHMLGHTGEKPYHCDLCPKTFTHKRGLIVHLRQHTAGDKYRCNIKGCGKSFYARWVLDCHIMKHTGKSSFTCRYCDKGFPRVCHYNKHMKLKHPEVRDKLPKQDSPAKE